MTKVVMYTLISILIISADISPIFQDKIGLLHVHLQFIQWQIIFSTRLFAISLHFFVVAEKPFHEPGVRVEPYVEKCVYYPFELSGQSHIIIFTADLRLPTRNQIGVCHLGNLLLPQVDRV